MSDAKKEQCGTPFSENCMKFMQEMRACCGAMGKDDPESKERFQQFMKMGGKMFRECQEKWCGENQKKSSETQG